jgi:BirA family transcriptional regulator, biotin operon repressor / biotin---[acetyl-CoA-carboxylase] ligase
MKKKLDIRWYESIDSTNLQAVRESDTAPDMCVWAACFQTAGRGQRGNKWEGAKNMNLTFTILFKPHFLPPSKQFLISEISAIGICRYLKNKGVEATIKWPNDIYVGDKKICGMLIEHSISGEGISYSISGIGINLNQRIFNSDAPNPTSLSLVKYPDTLSGYSDIEKDSHLFTENEPLLYNVKEELNEVLHHIFELYNILSDDLCASVIEREYLGMMYRKEGYYFFEELSAGCTLAPVNTEFYRAGVDRQLQELSKVRNHGKIIEAKIVGLDDDYHLILEQRDGVSHSYAFKEIKFLL